MDPIENQTKISDWISAIRLRTLPLSVAGILVSTLLARHHEEFNPWVCLGTFLTALGLQTLSNLANDYGDGIKGTDGEKRVGPPRSIQSGRISPTQMQKAIRINIFGVLLLGIATIYLAFERTQMTLFFFFLFLGLIAIVAALRYTIGKTAYGYKGYGDYFVFVFFGLVSVIGSYFLFTKSFDFGIIIPASIIGLLSVAVLNLNNMRDLKSDIESNKITMAVKLGEKWAKQYHGVLILGASTLFVVRIFLVHRSNFDYLFLLAITPLLIHYCIVYRNSSPEKLDPQLKFLSLTTLLLAVLLGLECFAGWVKLLREPKCLYCAKCSHALFHELKYYFFEHPFQKRS